MASTLETTEQNDLTNFNWDDSSDNFFNIGDSGEEIEVKKEQPTPVEVKDEPTEVKDNPADEPAEESFFDEENTPKEEDTLTEGTTLYEDVYKDLKEAGIFKHVELELEEGEEFNADKLYELQQQEIEAEVAARLETWATEDLDEDAKAFIKFKVQGGDTAEFFRTYGTDSDLSLGDIEDEDYQDKVIRTQLKKEGWDSEEIEDRLEYLTESGKKEKMAQKYFSRIEKEKELEKQSLEAQALEQKERVKQQEEQFRTSIKDVLETNKDIKGIKISEKDKGVILNLLTKKDQKIDNKRSITGFQKKLSEVFNDPTKVVLLAKLVNEDFDFSAFEKAVVTKKTREVKNNIEQRQSMRPTGSGSSSGGSNLASFFEK